MLEWLHLDNVAQAKAGRGYFNENGLRSQIWTQSPLKKNENIPGNKSIRTDGCAYGLEDSYGNPLEKAYRFHTNLVLAYSCKRCRGHGTKSHVEIEGNETSKSIVYQKQLVLAFLKDFAVFWRKFTPKPCLLSEQIEQPPQLLNTSLALQVTRLYSQSRLPYRVPGTEHSLYLHVPQTLILQPNEWRAVHMGVRFSCHDVLTASVELPLAGCEIRNGLSFQSGTATLRAMDVPKMVWVRTGSRKSQ